MKKEFKPLSEKGVYNFGNDSLMYSEKDLKEHIKMLKEKYNKFAGKYAISMPEFEKIVNEVFGDKLCKELK